MQMAIRECQTELEMLLALTWPDEKISGLRIWKGGENHFVPGEFTDADCMAAVQDERDALLAEFMSTNKEE